MYKYRAGILKNLLKYTFSADLLKYCVLQLGNVKALARVRWLHPFQPEPVELIDHVKASGIIAWLSKVSDLHIQWSNDEQPWCLGSHDQILCIRGTHPISVPFAPISEFKTYNVAKNVGIVDFNICTECGKLHGSIQSIRR